MDRFSRSGRSQDLVRAGVVEEQEMFISWHLQQVRLRKTTT